MNEMVNLRGILSFSIFVPKHIQNETNLILVFSWQSSALVKKRRSSINFIYGCSPLLLLRLYANHQNGFKCKVCSKAKWLFFELFACTLLFYHRRHMCEYVWYIKVVQKLWCQLNFKQQLKKFIELCCTHVSNFLLIFLLIATL